MQRTILITGATDGLGLETAKLLAAQGDHVLLHGRSESKLLDAEQRVSAEGGAVLVETYLADLSDAEDIETLAKNVAANHERLDVLINNAGVFRLSDPVAENGLDLRFMVNTVAPYLLARRLLPMLDKEGRVINLSSAAQAPVNPDALVGRVRLDDSNAYAQSKLALTMWSYHLAQELGADGPAVIAVNPGSFLGTKMVREAYGTAGNDIGIGAKILSKTATSDEFADASGRYFDNDSGAFANPHPDALDPQKNAALVDMIDTIVSEITQ